MRNPETSEPKPRPQTKVQVANRAQELAKDRNTEQVADSLLKFEAKMQRAINMAKRAGIATEVLFNHKQGQSTEDQRQADIEAEQELAKIMGIASRHTGMAVSSDGMVLSYQTYIPGLTIIRGYDLGQATFDDGGKETAASFEGLKQNAVPDKVSYEMVAEGK